MDNEFDYGKEVKSWRGFKFQNGERELKEASETVLRDGFTEIELDSEDELAEVFSDLEKYGVYKVEDAEYDYKAVDTVEHPDFFARITFAKRQAKLSELKEDEILKIDIYIIPEEEEDYDEIGWG